jgi:ethanolamine utilization cobalamin adenosyltransferase
MTPEQIKRNTIRAIVLAQEGKIFTVQFIKKDGTERTLTGRLGVTKYLVGGENTVAHKPEYLTVFDMQKVGYRNVNLDTVMALRSNGVDYIIQKKENQA